MTRASMEETRRFLALLARPGDVFELRGLARVNGQQQTTSGYFDDVEALVRAAAERSGKDDGVYITVNPVNPALLARAPKNRVRRAGTGDTTSDRDVATRRSILIDVDPIRPAGISSTDEEHDAAIALARQIADTLISAGWPVPILADSGNGAHLVFAVDLPVDDGGLVKRVLERLSKQFSTQGLKVDEKVFNPARISKIYGTLTRKGENTTERPHRIARIIEAPESLQCVSRELLEALAPSSPAKTPPRNGYQANHTAARFDIDAWIAAHLPDAIPQSWTEGRKWLLPVCPFNSDHDRREAYITEKHSGALAAGCQHESCFKSWRELRLMFEPNAYDRNGQGNGPVNGYANGHRITDREPPPEVLYQDAQYQDDIDAFAARDMEPSGFHDSVRAPAAPKPPKWKRAPDLVEEIWSRKDEPWIGLTISNEELIRVRAGGIAVVIGGSGSGKSSLVSNILLRHAKEVGPAIALSIELPADELAARIVGIRCDASWEEALTGRVRREFMVDALDLPRLYILDRKNATIENLAACVDAARRDFPGQPILAAVDYAQLIHSKEREVRLRVSDAFERIDDVARDKRVAVIAVSQMGRAGAKAARQGEAIGADAADLGAESAAIERFATVTLTIGQKGEVREDSSEAVELSIGKARMGQGDRVVPMSYWGRSGVWRVAGEARRASDVRDARDAEKEAKVARALEHQLLGAAAKSTLPLSREQLMELVTGRKDKKRAAIGTLLANGDLVEVARRAPRSRSWTVWTLDRVADFNSRSQDRDAKLRLVRDMDSEGGT